jgi:hypothetical protein
MQTRDRPNEVIVFVIGGTTYEESRSVAQYNAQAAKVRCVAPPPPSTTFGEATRGSSGFLELHHIINTN